MLDLPLALRAELVLWLEALLLVPLAVGYYLIRRRRRPRKNWHCGWLTAAFVAKTLLFLWGMAPVFLRLLPFVVSGLDTPTIQITVLHALVGAASLVLGWWVLLALHFKVPLGRRRTPRALRAVMRWTALTWVAGFALGAAYYWLVYR